MPRLSKGLILHVRQHEIEWQCIIKTYSGTEEAELHIFGSQGKAAVWKPNFTSREVRKSESGISAIWQSRRSRSAEAGNFISLEVPAEMKYGSGPSNLWKS